MPVHHQQSLLTLLVIVHFLFVFGDFVTIATAWVSTLHDSSWRVRPVCYLDPTMQTEMVV